MPKRGNGRNLNYSRHFEHDDHNHCKITKRVTFKVSSNKGKNKDHWNDFKLLLNEDIKVEEIHYSGFSCRASKLHPNMKSSWYKILIPGGAKYEKDVLLKALLSYVSPEIFIPHFYKLLGHAAMFSVNDAKVAEKLFYADRKITMSDGFNLVIIVRDSVSNENIDESLKEKMKLVMAKRYNPVNKALDLTKFHADPELANEFCYLFRPVIMNAAIDIIAESIPDLEALNLNDNQIHRTDHLRSLSTKLKNLKILYIAENKMTHIFLLDPLKPLPLEELLLAGNPLVNRFSDHDAYVSDVRKKFPKLIKLDGVELPPAIGFDVEEHTALPPIQQSFLIDLAGQDLVRDFLTQYYTLYDSDSRQPLLEAYHELATMSMTAKMPMIETYDKRATMSMSAKYLSNDNKNITMVRLNSSYMGHNRNIMRNKRRESRRRYLKSGRLHVVSFLSNLPKTQHDILDFAVDVPVFTPTMIMLTVNGVFRETNVGGNPLRSFHRTFVIVPNNKGGFCIINDMLFVTNTTKEQNDKAFSKDTLPEASPAPAPISTSALSPAINQVPNEQNNALISMLSKCKLT